MVSKFHESVSPWFCWNMPSTPPETPLWSAVACHRFSIRIARRQTNPLLWHRTASLPFEKRRQAVALQSAQSLVTRAA